MLSLMILGLGALALLGTMVLAYLYAGVGVGLYLAGFLLEMFVDPTPPVAVLGSIQIYFTDLAVLAVAGATALRLIYLAGSARLPGAVAALLVFAVVFAASFARGVLEFSPQAAGVEFRRYLGFLAIALYLITFRPSAERLRGMLWLWMAVAYVLCGLALVRWGAAVFAGEIGRLRVIDSRATLVVTQALLLCLYLVLVRDARAILRWSAAAFLPFVILLQHRTIWVILLVAIVIVAAREGKLRARLAGLLAFGAVAVAVGSLLLFGEESDEILGESASEGSTFVWRLIGWRALLQEHLAEPAAVLFGEAFGAGFERFLPELGYTVNVTPHNFYITVLLRGGVVALICFGAAYAFATWANRTASRATPETHWGHGAAHVLLISQLVYFLSYDPHHEQGIVLGVGMSLAAAFVADRWAGDAADAPADDGAGARRSARASAGGTRGGRADTGGGRELKP